MSWTTLDQLGDTIPTIIEKALLTIQFSTPMASLCWNKAKGQGKGSTVNLPYFGEVSVNTLAEKNDMVSSETMKDTNVQITLNEIGAKIILTDNALEDDQEELKSIAGKILGQAYGKKVDTDLLGQLDDGTTSMGGAGTTLTMGHIAAARARLMGNPTSAGGPAPMSYAAVQHPYVLLDLVDVVTPVLGGVAAASTVQAVGGSAFTDEILRNYTIGRLFGIPIYEDGNLSIDTSDDAKGGVFSTGEGGAIVLATARPMNIEPERDASARAWELNCVGRYGVGEYMAGWIVELYNDAGTPA